MRLLNTLTRGLAVFVSDDGIPPYAILSHTWGEDEVLFQDMLCPGVESKKGYSKIKYACEQAQADTISWLWVDTCCIDKSSSAELSEAINSMFAWYKHSVVCYAYLSDVVDVSAPETLSLQFGNSRWFTRGWTLQELLAPSVIRFYSAKWSPLGSREDLGRRITEITRIDGDFLRGRDLRLASIAKRMSWAALRETSRREDLAYCLLGIFNINMPLLYGEGQKAFIRLQEEIVKSVYDYSLFAWGIVDQAGDLDREDPSGTGAHLVAWKKDTTPLRGLLANSPRAFASSCSVVVHKPFMNTLETLTQPPASFDGGIRIQLPTLNHWDKDSYWWESPSLLQSRPGCIAILGCKLSDESKHSIGIPLVGWGHRSMGRRNNLVLVSDKIYSPLLRRAIRYRLQQIFIKPEMQLELRTGDIIFRKFDCHGMDNMGQDYQSLRAQYNRSERLLRPLVKEPNTRLFASYWARHGTNDTTGFAVVFGKHNVNSLSLANRPLYVGFASCDTHPSAERSDWIFSGPIDANLAGQKVLRSPSDSVT